MKYILFTFIFFCCIVTPTWAQKSVSSVIAQGYVDGSCNNLYMSATIGQAIIGTSQCGPYSVILGFQQPIELSTTPTYDLVFHSLKVFPNPAVDKLLLSGSLSTAGNSLQIKIIDLLGREQLHQKIKDFNDMAEIDIAHLQSGIYSLVITKSANEMQTILFVKQ